MTLSGNSSDKSIQWYQHILRKQKKYTQKKKKEKQNYETKQSDVQKVFFFSFSVPAVPALLFVVVVDIKAVLIGSK